MENIKYEQQGKIVVISIDRPQKLNALSLSTMRELAVCWKKFKTDPSAWVTVLTGTGDRAFCVGADISDPDKTGNEEERELFELWMSISPRKSGVNKPVICAIKGHCLGFGWWLAMECDMRIASTDAKLGIPEAKIGICPIFGGLVSEHLPPAITLELLLTGKPLDAKRAYELGFINQLVEPEEVENASLRLAETILDNAPVAVRRAKELFYKTLQLDQDRSLDRARIIFQQLEHMEDKEEAILAFKEKRKPQWKER